MSREEIKLSIALVTRNRPDSLERTLKSMQSQDVQPFEIIISDDSNAEEAITENKNLAEKYFCKYISGPKKGLYANRNFVARQTSGTHIRTMDDDHEFPRNHIKECINAIESDQNAVWTIGEYYPWDKDRPVPAPIPGQLHPRGYSYAPKNMNGYFGLSCGGSIYPKRVVDENILNLETYPFGILYLEYGVRLFKRGFKINHLNKTYILHYYDENKRSVSSLEVINSARIFCMFMFSFFYSTSVRNKFLTVFQISLDLLRRKSSIAIVKNAYKQFKKESNFLSQDILR